MNLPEIQNAIYVCGVIFLIHEILDDQTKKILDSRSLEREALEEMRLVWSVGGRTAYRHLHNPNRVRRAVVMNYYRK